MSAPPDLVETVLAISRRCSALPDLDTRPADEILGYEAISVQDGAPLALDKPPQPG